MDFPESHAWLAILADGMCFFYRPPMAKLGTWGMVGWVCHIRSTFMARGINAVLVGNTWTIPFKMLVILYSTASLFEAPRLLYISIHFHAHVATLPKSSISPRNIPVIVCAGKLVIADMCLNNLKSSKIEGWTFQITVLNYNSCWRYDNGCVNQPGGKLQELCDSLLIFLKSLTWFLIFVDTVLTSNPGLTN